MKGTELVAQGYKNVGRFYIGSKGDIVGPEAYMKSEAFAECKRKVEAGTHILIGGFPIGTDTPTMLGVIFQTDYAGWKGTREMMAWGR